MNAELLTGLPPVVSPQTRLLVLGSFPGVASLQAQQYYAHPRNHFWPILAAVWRVDFVAMSYDRRLQALLAHGVGLWDIHASCRRVGSLDQAIEDAEPNELAVLQTLAPDLRWVAHNGGESARARRQVEALGWVGRRLPSTSPANASWSFDRKLLAWRAMLAEAGLIEAGLM